MNADERQTLEQAKAMLAELTYPIVRQILEYIRIEREVSKGDEVLIESLVRYVLISWIDGVETLQDLFDKCQKNQNALLGSIVPVVELMRSVVKEEKTPERWGGLTH